MTDLSRRTIFINNIIHSKSYDELEMLPTGFVVVQEGIILEFGSKIDLYQYPLEYLEECNMIYLNNDEFIIPGFIDCHIHAPQMPNLGLGLDKPLLEWLDYYTYPLEMKYDDIDFSKKIYNQVVDRTLKSGTTTACYFATNYTESSVVLAEQTVELGQRAFIGKVSANCGGPVKYRETSESAVQELNKFIEKVKGMNSDLVQPVVTPRFALSCDMPLMKELGEIANKNDLLIQSHISENIDEIKAVKNEYKTLYSQVYDEAKLLTNKTILAHGVHLENAEIELLAKRGTTIVHCPTSNTKLGSGLCDVKRLMQGGVKVCLGTDCSGGSNVSILNVIRDALDVSLHLNFMKKQYIQGTGKIELEDSNDVQNKAYKPLSLAQIFYLATLGGAKALNLDKKIGNFQSCKTFDALFIKLHTPQSSIDNIRTDLDKDITPAENLKNIFEKFIYCGDTNNIYHVYVEGKVVKSGKN